MMYVGFPQLLTSSGVWAHVEVTAHHVSFSQEASEWEVNSELAALLKSTSIPSNLKALLKAQGHCGHLQPPLSFTMLKGDGSKQRNPA